jgi:hypothetical protein
MESAHKNNMEHEIRRALERLYREERLKNLHAPDIILERGQALVAESRRVLGEAVWQDVVSRYSTFSEFLKDRDRKNSEWNEKCATCKYWRGDEYDVAFGTENDVSDEEFPWCAKYTVLKITRPAPCPDFDPDHD